MREKLIAEITELLRVFKVERPVYSICHGIWKASDNCTRIQKLLGSYVPCEIFHDRMQYFGNSASRVQYEELLDWIVYRAVEAKPQTAVDDLFSYLYNDTFSGHAITLIADLHVDGNLELGHGVRLITPHQVPNSRLRQALVDEMFSVVPGPKVRSVLITDTIHKKQHFPAYEEEKFEFFSEEFRKLEDMRLLMSLIGNCRGTQAIASALVAADQIPCLTGFAWKVHAFRPPAMYPGLMRIEAHQVEALYEEFRKRSDDEKNHLRIILSKLTDANTSTDAVQKAVDLRTCIESIFLDDNLKLELGFRLSLRAALLLGKSQAERKKVQKDFKECYSITSTAVHRGKFNQKEMKRWQILYTEVSKRVKGAVRLLIANGPVDWQAIELGATSLPDEHREA